MTDNSSAIEETIIDPVEEMLKKTGCIELHYEVQDCISTTQDWRACQKQVQHFKQCMEEYQSRRKKEQFL